jgi:hypothetical protein
VPWNLLEQWKQIAGYQVHAHPERKPFDSEHWPEPVKRWAVHDRYTDHDEQDVESQDGDR